MNIALREIRAEGFAEGYAEGVDLSRMECIAALMETLKLTAVEAMDVLQIPTAERDKYLARL